MKTIYDRLREYSDSDYYGFHMPGHKRQLYPMQGVNPYAIDITEIDGFDDLHHAQGILKDAQERAARLYGVGETHFLINGSTAGILSAILGVTKKGDSILVARNCHKSVYHAIYLNELNPVYLYPKFDDELGLNTEISAEDVRRALGKYPQIRAVVIVSPTYDGVVSDVSNIAEAVHEHGVPLIVDEAHGAHFGLHPYFPENSGRLGADLVIHSVHKTLPAFTQTALLHVNGTIVDRSRVKRYLDMLQTSSPSYVLMAGIDQCMELMDHHRQEVLEPYVEMLQRYRERLGELKHIRLLYPKEAADYDRSKLVLSVAGTTLGGIEMTGKWLSDILIRDYHLQPEMAAGTYVLAMTGPGDTEAGFERLTRALEQIDKELEDSKQTKADGLKHIPEADVAMSIAEAIGRYEEDEGRHVRNLAWSEAIGYISMEYAYLYPPGIPILAPGERVTNEAVEMLSWYQERNYSVEGIRQEGRLEVWIDG